MTANSKSAQSVLQVKIRDGGVLLLRISWAEAGGEGAQSVLQPRIFGLRRQAKASVCTAAEAGGKGAQSAYCS